MSQTRVAISAFLSTLLAGLSLAASSEPLGGRPGELLPLATLVSDPDRYGGKEVLVQGLVVEVTRATFPNGRLYYILKLGDAGSTITVFSWERPAVERGDRVEVQGVFYVWRYNLRHMIDGGRIIRIRSSSSSGEGGRHAFSEGRRGGDGGRCSTERSSRSC